PQHPSDPLAAVASEPASTSAAKGATAAEPKPSNTIPPAAPPAESQVASEAPSTSIRRAQPTPRIASEVDTVSARSAKFDLLRAVRLVARGWIPVGLAAAGIPSPQQSVLPAINGGTDTAMPPAKGVLRADAIQDAPVTAGSGSAVGFRPTYRLTWMPWHARVLSPNAVPEHVELDYRALNSVAVSAEVAAYRRDRGALLIRPQLSLQRFQTVFTERIREVRYAPNTVVAYQQDYNGFKPILSDSIAGIRTLHQRENGQWWSVQIPAVVEYRIIQRGIWQLYSVGTLGAQYRSRPRGLWWDGQNLADVSADVRNWGVMATGGLSTRWNWGPRAVEATYAAGYQTPLHGQSPQWAQSLAVSLVFNLR
ncbi:MAG: hypothetical protein RIR07_323, partial [Bacteroidota bacterium]